MSHQIYFLTKGAIVQSFIMQNTYLFILSFVITRPFPESSFTLEVGMSTCVLVRLFSTNISFYMSVLVWHQRAAHAMQVNSVYSLSRSPAVAWELRVRTAHFPRKFYVHFHKLIFLFSILNTKRLCSSYCKCYVDVWRLFDLISSVFAESFLWFLLCTEFVNQRAVPRIVSEHDWWSEYVFFVVLFICA